MIEPSFISNKGTSRVSKATAEETKTSSDFGALLELEKTLDGKEEKKEAELWGFLNQLFQVIPIGKSSSEPPFLSKVNDIQLIENKEITVPGSSLQQIEKDWLSLQIGKLAAEDSMNISSLHPIEKERFGLQIGKLAAADAMNIDSSSSPLLETDLNASGQSDESQTISTFLTQENGKDLIRTETPNSLQMEWNASFNGTSVGTPSPQSIDAKEKTISPVPVQASQLVQDVTEFFQSAVRVQTLGDKMEAIFSLTPGHLGTVDVKVSIQDGHVTAQFYANTTLGRELLELHVDSLQTALQQQGLQVDKIEVSQQSSSTFPHSFSQGGDSSPKQGQQDARKRNERFADKKQEEYHDSFQSIGWESQINTTA